MVSKLMKWMEPPVFPGDEEKTHLAVILDKMLLAAWVFQLFGLFIYPGDLGSRLLLAGAYGLSALGLQIALRKGSFTWVNHAFLSIYWLLITATAFMGGGIIPPVTASYCILVLWAAVSLEKRGIVLMVTVIMVSSLLMAFTHGQGWRAYLVNFDQPLAAWGVESFVLIALAVIGGLVTSHLRSAFHQARLDLNERLKAQKELGRFQELAERARDVFLMIDPKTGRVLYGNRAAQAAYGYTGSELDALNMRDLRSGEPVLADQKPASAEDVLIETRHMRKDGSTFPVESSSAHFELEGEDILISVVRDISERKRAEDELSREHEITSAVLETIPSLVVVVDCLGRIMIWNQACADLTGYSAREAIGRLIWDFMVPGAATDQARQTFSQQLVEHVPLQFENQWFTRSGDLRQIAWHNNFLLDGEGQVRFVIDSGQDVTEKRQMEKTLADSEAMFRSVFEQAALGILIADGHAILLDFNQRLCDMFGYSREEMLGRSINDFAHPDQIAYNSEDARKLIRGNERQAIWENRYIRKDGSTLWTHSGITLIRAENGQPRLFITIMEDITDRKRTEMELKALNIELEGRVRDRTAELEVINKELEAFNYSVSHDLRAPLRSMSGFAQALWEDFGHLLPEEGRGYIQRIEISTEKMEDLINDLLKLSRLGRKPIDRIKTHPDKIANLVWEELKEEVGERNINLKIHKMPVCMADPVLLKQVYSNLLSNAIKYTRPRPLAEITLGCTRQDGRLVFWIKDNGVGFNMQYADKLFGIFQRLHSENQFEGLGVGLAIVQRIINRHNGQVWAEAAENKGATFFFTLGANP